MKDIVIGVDGTNSFAYRNGSRFVENFVRSVQSDFSLYLPGPTDLQGATGFECSAIYDQVMAFILSTLRELGYNQRVCTVRPEVRISLVGHSRGGHTVIAVARDLQLPVHFMGLYDAVDMTVTLGDTMVVRNTAYTYHAMRSPTMRSRSSWGNTGTSSLGNFFLSRYFETNHGGMGGDTGDTPTPVIGDEACVYRPPQPRYRSIARTDMVIELPPLPPSSVGERRSDVSVLCGSQSSAVDLWIREGAIQRGLRFARS